MRRRDPVGAYVIHRIRAEFFGPTGEPIRGKQAEIAERTGFTTSQVNHVFQSARTGSSKGVGPAFARAMAEKVWGLTYARLDELAKAWAEHQPDEEPETAAPPRWRSDPAWPAALAEALALNAKRGVVQIPAQFFEQAGDASIPERAPTGDGVLRLAELLAVTPARPRSS